MKNTKSKRKPMKIGKQSGTINCFVCKDYKKILDQKSKIDK